STEKEAAELWAFSAAILPAINACDADVATTLRDNADITLDTAPMSAGYAAVKAELESVYVCMGITCAQDPEEEDDSGDASSDSAGDDNGGTAVTSTGSSDDSGLSGGGVAGVTIAVGAVAVAAIAFFVIRKRRSK
ncbi:unnamed protein product, partial [Scytosiphon promiscuus]